MQSTKRLAIDPGRRFVKTAWIDEETTRITTIPSVAGIGTTDIGQLSLGQSKEGPPAPRPYEVTGDGLSYVVGEGTRRYAHPTAGLYLLWSHDGPLVEALFYGALYRLLGPGEHRIELHVAMPLRTVNGIGAFEDWMHGQHVVKIDGDQVVFDVIDIETYSDAMGAFYAWGLDDDGNWRNPSTLREYTAVLDVGYSALHMSVLRGGEVIQHRPEDTGTGFLADVIQGQLLEHHDYSLEIFEADKLLYAERPQIHTANGPEDLSKVVSRAKYVLETDVETVLNWTDYGHVILTGGGVQLLSAQDPITDRHRQAHVLDEPITAIVRGLASYIARTNEGGSNE
jgi:hypothetical protein